jgi:hypothetical protein
MLVHCDFLSMPTGYIHVLVDDASGLCELAWHDRCRADDMVAAMQQWFAIFGIVVTSLRLPKRSEPRSAPAVTLSRKPGPTNWMFVTMSWSAECRAAARSFRSDGLTPTVPSF